MLATNSNISQTAFSANQIRADFPILQRKIQGNTLVYFDNAASMQMPSSVIERVSKYRSLEHSNVHRGVHTLSQEATDMYESVRNHVKTLFLAPDDFEVVFTSGTTFGMNLLARGLRKSFLPGDQIIVSESEHHANLVPWQMMKAEYGIEMVVVPISEHGTYTANDVLSRITPKTVLVSLSAASNVTGVRNPVKEIGESLRSSGIFFILDGAQAAAHRSLSLSDVYCDALAFSSHKIGGPNGAGAVLARRQILEKMEPFIGGGDMIKNVGLHESTWADIPYRFEAGTPAIEQIIGMGEAILYWEQFDRGEIHAHETALSSYATQRILSEIQGVRIFGNVADKEAIVSFTVENVHPHDLGTFLDQQGVAVRVGHHCAQPFMKRFGIPGTIRLSIAPYNTKEEIDVFMHALKNSIQLLRD